MNVRELRRLAEQEIQSRPPGEVIKGDLITVIEELQIHQVELEIQNEELKRVQLELHDTAAKYIDLFDLSPVGYLTLDPTGRVLEANSTAEDMLGVPRHLLRRRPIQALMTEEDADAFTLHLRRAYAHRTTERSDIRMMRANGTTFPALVASTVPRDRDLCLTTIVDLTDKRKVEEELREAIDRFTQLTDQIDDIYFVFQPSERKMVYVSPGLERVFGIPPRYVMDATTDLSVFLHRDDAARVLRSYAGLMLGDPLDIEFRLLRSDGEYRMVRARAFLSPGQDRVAGMITDVTDERRMEEELRHAQKMEAVGALASGIAHDFNNLLMGVIGFATVAMTRMEKTHPGFQEVKRIVDIAKRGEGLTRKLLDFSRKRPAQTAPVEIDALVSEARPLIETLVGESVRVVLHTDAHRSRIRANPGEIEQMLMNLATNARDSMKKGGTLEIRTSEVYGSMSARYVTLSVKDTGSGMDEETRSRIFEPFFTTKGVGEGTGLGLSTTFGLVRRLGGRIEVESALGAGTTFTIHLPTVPETVEIEHAPSLMKGHGSILVIEDDPFVRESVSFYLECIGYTPLLAAGAEQALELVKNDKISVDVVLTDVMMPFLLGRDLANEIRNLRPGVKVVYMSAHPRDELAARGRVEPDALVLQKPFDEQRLALMLHKLTQE